MWKQGLIYLLMSILIIVFSRYLHLLVVYIDILYTKTNLLFAPVFSHSPLGMIIRGTLVLTLLPILISAIPTLLYRAIKGKIFPYYLEVIWIIWLIIVISKIII